MSGSNNKMGELSSVGIPGRGLSYITPHLQGHKGSRRKMIIKWGGLLLFITLLLVLGSRFLFPSALDGEKTLTINDIVTQTWQAQTRMADAISTVQIEMLGGKSSLLDATIEPGLQSGVTEMTPEPSTTGN